MESLILTQMSVHLFVLLFVCLPVCLPICLSIRLPVCILTPACHSAYRSVYLPVSLCLCVCVSVRMHAAAFRSILLSWSFPGLCLPVACLHPHCYGLPRWQAGWLGPCLLIWGGFRWLCPFFF